MTFGLGVKCSLRLDRQEGHTNTRQGQSPGWPGSLSLSLVLLLLHVFESNTFRNSRIFPFQVWGQVNVERKQEF